MNFVEIIKKQIPDEKILSQLEPLFSIMDTPDKLFDEAGDILEEMAIKELEKTNIRSELAGYPYDALIESKQAFESLINLVNTAPFGEAKRKFLVNYLSYLIGILEFLTNRELIKLPIELEEGAICPTYAHETDGCMDIYALEDTNIPPNTTIAVRTGIKMAIPNGWRIEIYPRSGLSFKSPLRLANSVGIIDTGYRDELKILLWNSSDNIYSISKGDRIAQMGIAKTPKIVPEIVTSVARIGENRGGGLGSSGQ